MTMTAFIMPVLIGFMGVAVDISNWYLEKREMQSVTDMAAMEAAHLQNYYDTNEEIKTAVKAWLADKGINSGTDQVTINIPPSSGKYNGLNGFAEILVDRDEALYFSSAFFALFSGENFDVEVSTRAVAGGIDPGGNACVVAFNTAEPGALDFSGNAGVDAECGIATNSNHLQSIEVGGTSDVLVTDVSTAGDIYEFGNGNLSLHDEQSGSVSTFAPDFEDPFEDLPFPSNQGCDHAGTVSPHKNGSVEDRTLEPGVYCGGIDIGSGVDILLKPGVYFIQGSDLEMQGNMSIDTTGYTGSDPGVSFIFTQDSGGNVGTISKWNAQASVNLTAKNSGDYAGLIFAQDPAAGDNDVHINGGANTIIDGALYLPKGDLKFNGNSSNDGCLLLYADTIEFTGTNDVNIDMDETFCEDLGLSSAIIGLSNPRVIHLVE
ncbi:hypothetical protein GCM10017044_01220 [Kordiimonas sediminis]|uniref:Putative Flp pilus-assembly TadG-like N-terminal domain-containing protein n=1 Tax=Kordiimonas sediminis TaxID=1735581 RepID=A0A919AIR6_9PROT|nr:pilus assembly protein TadG-related protein [Kordiimonas sediminis]GHF11244.1 hypothetical protein GCM10017044_01220 [Kordiimonas sediminis]